MKRNLEDFLALPLSKTAQERILWSNAERVFSGS
jgi:hypothetical protein